MEKVSIKVTIKSFQQPAVEAAIRKVMELAKLQQSIHRILIHTGTNLRFVKHSLLWTPLGKRDKQERWSCTFLPPSVRKFTVLRSPHIDKKSREQFQQRSVTAVLCISPTWTNVAPLLLALLRNSQLVGVQLKVTVASAASLYE